jgi:hypothetical protein
MKINVINTETLKRFIKEEITNVINESKACERLSGPVTKGEFFLVTSSRDYVSTIAACAYGSARMWYKMQEFYFKNAKEMKNGEYILPKAVERAARKGASRRWPRLIRFQDEIYIPTDEELSTMKLDNNTDNTDREYRLGIDAFSTTLELAKKLRQNPDNQQEVIQMHYALPTSDTRHNGRRWARAIACAGIKEGEIIINHLCSGKPQSATFCTDCNELEQHKVRADGDVDIISRVKDRAEQEGLL